MLLQEAGLYAFNIEHDAAVFFPLAETEPTGHRFDHKIVIVERFSGVSKTGTDRVISSKVYGNS